MMNPVSGLLTSMLVVAGLLGAGCATSQTTTTPSGAPLARQLTQSAHCGLIASGHIHLTDRSEVDQLAELPGASLSLTPLRDIDFDREHVVVVSLGQKRTGGYSVTLVDSRIRNGQLELIVHIREPAPGAMVTQALTTPCAVMAVAATGWDGILITEPENKR